MRLSSILNWLAIVALVAVLIAHEAIPAEPACGPSICDSMKGNGCWSTITKPRPLDRDVRIFTTQPFSMIDGSTFSSSQLLTILFLSEPCPLSLRQRESMHRSWQERGAYQLGCWYPTPDGGFTIVYGDGTFHHNRMSAEVYPRAHLHPDGSATIDDPGYGNLEQAISRLDEREARERRQHWRDKP